MDAGWKFSWKIRNNFIVKCCSSLICSHFHFVSVFIILLVYGQITMLLYPLKDHGHKGSSVSRISWTARDSISYFNSIKQFLKTVNWSDILELWTSQLVTSAVKSRLNNSKTAIVCTSCNVPKARLMWTDCILWLCIECKVVESSKCGMDPSLKSTWICMLHTLRRYHMYKRRFTLGEIYPLISNNTASMSILKGLWPCSINRSRPTSPDLITTNGNNDDMMIWHCPTITNHPFLSCMLECADEIMELHYDSHLEFLFV